jgi:hypothetical protein
MQTTAKLNAIFASAALPLLIIVSSATALGHLLPCARCVVCRRVGSSTPLLSLSCPPSNCPASSTPALSDHPALSTLASCCVVHRPITFQSVLCPPPLYGRYGLNSRDPARHSTYVLYFLVLYLRTLLVISSFWK